ncbi:hypothetical protein Bhyg_11326 [Pseudolycoriella hygida]|uniref:Uncharacterized protein n=1 Tax=Pseudolycoriella hygida TaxID=35572 RepID=A0A9Q0MWQ2_9DIPT|nr:hypothetical protein Bhyg_11326 [Pseudolycoriella hygida]
MQMCLFFSLRYDHIRCKLMEIRGTLEFRLEDTIPRKTSDMETITIPILAIAWKLWKARWSPEMRSASVRCGDGLPFVDDGNPSVMSVPPSAMLPMFARRCKLYSAMLKHDMLFCAAATDGIEFGAIGGEFGDMTCGGIINC